MAYAYKRKITITGQSGAGTNYQVKFLIGESSGSGTNDFHLAGHASIFPSGKNQGGDLKFFANDEVTALPFWVETVTGSGPNRVATVWVKVSADLGTNQDIWIYYGDSGASNLSNGDNTFLLFDDFDGALDTTNKWTAPGSYSIGSSYLVLNTTGNSLTTKNQYPDYTEIVALKSMPDTSASSVGALGPNETFSVVIANHYPGFTGNITVVRLYNGGVSDISFGTRYNGTTLRRMRVGRYNNNYRASIDSNVIGPNAYSGITGNQKYIVDSVYENQANPGVDWVFIKKFQATEPSFSSAASEQSALPFKFRSPSGSVALSSPMTF